MNPPPIPGAARPAGSALPRGIQPEQLLHALYFANLDTLLLVDAGGRIVGSNPAASQLLGYGEGELLGMSIEQLVPEAMRDRHAAYRAQYTQAPRTRPMGMQLDLAARRKDGSLVTVEIALSPLASDGQLVVVAALRDTSAYPRVKQAVRRARYSEQLARLGRLAADSRDPQVLLPQVPGIALQTLQADSATVVLVQPDLRELRVAGSAGAIATQPIGALLPRAADSFAARVLDAGRMLLVDDLAATTGAHPAPAYRAAGLRSVIGMPLIDSGRAVGALVVAALQPGRFGADESGFVESLANLLSTCLQRARSEEALSHAQRLESVGQLTGGIAHDFNNLLTVIQGNLQVLEDLPAAADPDQVQPLVAAAMRASRRGAELTGKLLAFSRRQVLQPSAVDVGALLEPLADMLRRTLDERVRIEVAVAAGCPPVLADPGQLENALLNIAINARDAMADGGVLRFHAEPCTGLPAGLRHELGEPAASDEPFVAISIGDTGSGMSDEVRERAFEPFFTTKEVGRGTGLGLSTVYGFVRQSSGAVSIDSAPGAGTTLTMYLPQVRGDAPAVDDADPAASVVPAGLRVLLVEDDPDVRGVERRFLDSLGCRTVEASSAEQALLALGADGGFDLLLSDIALGAGLRGTQLAGLAQQRHPALAVLLMSGYSSELLDADRDAPAGWELLRKPHSRAELAGAIARLTAGREPG